MPFDIRLASIAPGFTGEAGDPPGTRVIRVRPTVVVRKVSGDLEPTFEYQKD